MVNDPEKGSNPRVFTASTTLLGMLNRLPKTSDKVFGTVTKTTMETKCARSNWKETSNENEKI